MSGPIYGITAPPAEETSAPQVSANLVPYPNLWPNRCIICTSNTGPIYFGGTHGANEEAIYICRTCAEVIGVAFGFVEGDEMATLREAAAEIEQHRKEAQALASDLTAAVTKVESLRRELQDARKETEEARAELTTMEHQVADVRDVAGRLAAVGQHMTGAEFLEYGKHGDPED